MPPIRPGCRRFDGAVQGFGGLSYAKEMKTGKYAYRNVSYFTTVKADTC